MAKRVPAPNGGTLNIWEKGESGNPAGSSKKRRRKAYLRDLLPKALAGELSEEMIEKLKDKGIHIEAEIEGLTAGQVLATQIILRALGGDVKAVDQILSAEPRIVELVEDALGKPKSGEFIPVESESTDAEEVPEGIVH